MGRVMAWLGSVLLVAGLLPLILLLLAEGLARLGRCTVEAVDRIPPCTVAGFEVSGFLGIAALSGWLLILSWPVAAMGLALLAVAGLIALLRWARSRS